MSNLQHQKGTPEAGSKGRVVMLVSNNLAIDARVRKEAASAAKGGYETHVVGVGDEIPVDLADAPYTLHLAKPMINGRPVLPRLGKESVWKPLRVLVNLTVTRSRQKKYNDSYMRDDEVYTALVRRPEMEAVALSLKPDIVHCHDLDTLYAGYRTAQQTGAKLVYDSHEIYLELHFLNPTRKPMYEEIESEIFPQIDGFVTVSPAIGRILTKKYDYAIKPIVLYNGGTHIVDEVKPVGELPKLFFQGAFATDRNNLELVEAMVQLKGKATLTLQGWGPDEEAFAGLIKKHNLEDTVFVIPPCGPLEVVDSARNYDVGVINSKCIDENFRNTLPNKLFDYMCAGLAVASTDLPPIKEIIDEHDCGITYVQKGADHTAQVLLDLVSDPARIEEMKRNSLAAAPNFVWEAQGKKLVALYDSLMSNNGKSASDAR